MYNQFIDHFEIFAFIAVFIIAYKIGYRRGDTRVMREWRREQREIWNRLPKADTIKK